MRGNKNQSVAQSKKYVSIPKKQFEKFLKVQKGWAESTMGLRRDMRKSITEEVVKQLGDKINEIEGLYRQTVLMQKIFIDKKFITPKEINKKHEELKEK